MLINFIWLIQALASGKANIIRFVLGAYTGWYAEPLIGLDLIG